MSSSQANPGVPFAGPVPTASWIDPRFPSLTLATLIEAQHKNAAALGNANQAAFDGLRVLMQRQGHLMTVSLDTCTRVTGDLLAAGSLEEKAARQADVTRDTCLSVVARVRELSDIVIEANMAAIGIVNARIVEAFDDLRTMFSPAVSPVHGKAPSLALAAPAAAVEESAAVEEQPIAPVEPALPPVTAAPQVAPEAPVEGEAIAAPTASAEPIIALPEAATPPTPAPRSAAPAAKVPAAKATAPAAKSAAPLAKTAASPARTTTPKTPPLRPPRRPTSRS